jgi:hypothetical protein
MTTIVQYNRSAKLWELFQGNHAEALQRGGIVAYPAGKEGKRAAQLSALTHDAPEVAAEVDAFILAMRQRGFGASVDRAIRAGFIAAAGKVLHPRPMSDFGAFAGEVARVESTREPGENYAVTHNGTGYFCSCPDCNAGVKQRCLPLSSPDRPKFGAPFIPGFGYACKHAIAHCVAFRASVEPGDEADPFNGEPVPYSDAAGYDDEYFELRNG